MAPMRGPAGIGSELDEAPVRAGRYLRRGVVAADVRTLQKSGGREADSFYRDRWSYDKVVRSAHGVNCTGSCSWKVYVKDGIITWEAQQTDYPSAGLDRPDYEPRGCPRGAAFSWYTYSPARVRYPYVRGAAGVVPGGQSPPRRRPGRGVGRDHRQPRPRGPLQVRPRQGRLRSGELGRGGGARRGRARAHDPHPGSGPDRGVQPDPGDEHG
jgi:hypothetical protein